MSGTPDFGTVVLGSGFAGLTVAHALGASDCAVIDRGEPLDLARASARVDAEVASLRPQTLPGQLAPLVDLEARTLASQLPQNRVHLPLSQLSVNAMTYVQGGISNWWGGYAARISASTFVRDGVLSWPIDLHELAPYYGQAERLMRVHGDPTAGDHGVFAPLPGWDYWREHFAPLFPQARVTPQAKNVTDTAPGAPGLCLGNGHCGVCGNDAKARPANVFPEIDVIGGSRVDRIVFDGPRAVAVEGTASGEPFAVSFERLVVACGGIENVALLRRSALPDALGERIGSRFQDHTTCEVLGVLPRAFERYRLGAEGGVEIPELSGYIEGIEVKTVMLPSALTPEQIMAMAGTCGSHIGLLADLPRLLERTACFYLQMEVPPEWNLRLRTRGGEGYIHASPYLRHIPVLDAVVLEVARRMSSAGIGIAGMLPHHRNGFGGHHYSGTTPMSGNAHGVVDRDLRLIGTDNVYVNGGSVIPRCGGSGPTLTIAALGLRLGEHLAGLGT